MARKLLGIVPNVGDSSNKEAPTSWITTALNLKLDKTGLSASTPLSYNSGTGALSIQAASTTQDGYLSSANFNTFNNKEGAITAGTTSQYWRGDKSWQDLPSAIRSTVLTGLVAGTNRAIAATDSILAAFQNLQAQVNNKLGSTAQATDSDKLDGQHGSYYQTALGYTPLKNTTDTLTGDLTLSGGSLYLPATGFSGAGPIQSTVAVKFANATAAQEAYMLKLRLGGTWSILDSNDPGVGGIYASGTIKASSFVKSGGTGNQFLKADGSVDSSSYESTITAGTTSQYYRGDKTWQTLDTAAVTESTNLYFTNARVLGTVLTGLDTTPTGAVVASDTILAAIGKLENRVAGFTAYNRIKNGNSEDPNPTGYEAAWISDSGAYTGTRCRALTVADTYGASTVVGESPCDPGDQFVFSAWGKQAAASSGQRIYIEFKNAAGDTTGTTFEAFPASTVYTQAVVFGKAPAGTVKVRFLLQVYQPQYITTYYWDCLYAELKFPAVVLSGMTGTKTFYAASSKGGSPTVLNTVVVKDGIITSWTQA